ncbi:hypothetical protein [Rhodoferax koreensis]|nr:hypothetical protein [Rhodoferax koreense]
MRSRSVSPLVLAARLEVPRPPASVVADWERDIHGQLGLEPGDVAPLPLARTRRRWPDLRPCVSAAADWMQQFGLRDLLTDSDIALMACRGARFHHDGAQYGGAAFCNLFLSEDKGLDVWFPFAGQRIPLAQGTVLVFDTCQPHAVVERGSDRFDAAAFGPGRDCSQVFLTWELPVQDAALARLLGIEFDVEAVQLDDEQVRRDGQALEVCAQTGRPL